MPTAIITGARDGTFRRWNPDGTQEYSIDGVAYRFEAAKGFGPEIVLASVDSSSFDQSSVHKRNAADGSPIWNHVLASTQWPRSVDVSAEGVVVAQDQVITKLTAGGSFVWSEPWVNDDPWWSCALMPNGDVVAANDAGLVQRRAAADGAIVWSQSHVSAQIRGLSVDQSNSNIYFGTRAGDLFRLNPDGSAFGSPFPIDISTGRIHTVYLTDSLVLAGTGSGDNDPDDFAVHCYDKSGTFQWKTTQPDETEGIAVDEGAGFVYAGGRNNSLHKLALSDGTEETTGWPATGHTDDIKDVGIAILGATEVSRTVKDDATGDTVSGVRVVAIADNGDGSIAGTQTSDTNGVVTFTTLPSGTYALVAIDSSGNKIDAEYGVVIA